jgi:hypothetical protein
MYVLYDTDDLALFTGFVHELRAELGPLLRAEVRIGRPLFLLAN